jgi:hypothetical protein
VAGPRTEANDGGLPVSVEEGSRGSLKISACQVCSEDVLEVVSKSLNIIHVPKVGLSDVGNPEAIEDSLQPDKERFQVDDEEETS